MEDIRVAFGQNLKAMRKKLKWSQEELGEKADLHPTYVSAVERGEPNVSLEYIARLATAFRLPIAELFNFPVTEKSERERLQTELMILIRQQDSETCEFLLSFLKMLDGVTIKRKQKRRPPR